MTYFPVVVRAQYTDRRGHVRDLEHIELLPALDDAQAPVVARRSGLRAWKCDVYGPVTDHTGAQVRVVMGRWGGPSPWTGKVFDGHDEAVECARQALAGLVVVCGDLYERVEPTTAAA